MRRTVAETLNIAATHEAGHAVVATLCGTTVKEVVVDVQRRLFGGPVPHGWVEADSLTDDRRMKPADFLLDCMAGAAAEAALYSSWGWSASSIDRTVKANSETDRELAADEFAARGLRLSRGKLRRAEADAADVVASYWDEVCAVAVELVNGGGRLSGGAVKRAMRQ